MDACDLGHPEKRRDLNVIIPRMIVRGSVGVCGIGDGQEKAAEFACSVLVAGLEFLFQGWD